MIDWDKLPKHEADLIEKIVASFCTENDINNNHRLEFEIDLIAFHMNVVKIDLDKLSTIETKVRNHDIFGINGAIDRSTGKQKKGKNFLPKCHL